MSISRFVRLGIVLVSLSAISLAQSYRVFVGTYAGEKSKGIYSFEFDASKGKSSALELAATTESPSYLAADKQGRFVYAANEILEFHGKAGGSISVFKVDGPKLTEIQQAPSVGVGPVYVTIDRPGKHLLVSNYTNGVVASLEIEADGKLGRTISQFKHEGHGPNAERQEGPHAHAIQLSPDGRYALVCDLGIDKVMVYPYDEKTGVLSKAVEVKTAPGAGPRHLDFSKDGKFVYVANEMAGTVSVYAMDSATGNMHEVQSISTRPAGATAANTVAEIQMDRKGTSLYVSNRGDETIARFSVDKKTGKLTARERTPAMGKMPRFFSLDPTGKWLWVAHQGSGNLHLFGVNSDGTLKDSGTDIAIDKPVVMLFVKK